jgi:uncharacterized cupin superfamily protein
VFSAIISLLIWLDRKGVRGVSIATTLKIDREDVAAMALDEDAPIPTLDGGSMGTRNRTTYRSDDGSVETGVWECDAGRFRARFGANGEMIHIVSGEMVCTSEDGETFTLRPGDSATFPRGWSGEWDVRSPLRKVYATFTAQ